MSWRQFRAPTAYSGPVDLEASLDHLEELTLSAAPPDSDVTGGDVCLDLVGKFARLAWSAEGDQRVAVHERIQRLLKSGKPVLVHAGLDAMGDSARADPEEAEAALVQLLDRDNPDIVAIALRKADSQFHLADRPEIAKRLLEVPFRTELFERESHLGIPGLALALLPSKNGYDDTYRERTMELLRSTSSMVSGHCEVLLSIIAHRHDQTASKREALAALLETKDNTVSACSTVFHAHRSDLFVDEEPADVQIALLRDRAELVSPGALREYWRQFLSSKHARATSDDRLLAIVRAGLAEDQQSHALDKRALTQTQWLLGDLMRG